MNPEIEFVILWANSEDTELEVKREIKRLSKFRFLQNTHEEEE